MRLPVHQSSVLQTRCPPPGVSELCTPYPKRCLSHAVREGEIAGWQSREKGPVVTKGRVKRTRFGNGGSFCGAAEEEGRRTLWRQESRVGILAP